MDAERQKILADWDKENPPSLPIGERIQKLKNRLGVQGDLARAGDEGDVQAVNDERALRTILVLVSPHEPSIAELKADDAERKDFATWLQKGHHLA